MSIQTIKTAWNSIDLQITYNSNWSKTCNELYDYHVVHLEIISLTGEPMPISNTGFRSHFTTASLIDEEGGAETFTLRWMDIAAKSKQWIKYAHDSLQLELF